MSGSQIKKKKDFLTYTAQIFTKIFSFIQKQKLWHLNKKQNKNNIAALPVNRQ